MQSSTFLKVVFNYSKALLEVAKKQKKTDLVIDQVREISITIGTNKNINYTLQNIIAKPKVDKLVKNFINTLINNKRVNLLPQIFSKYVHLYNEYSNTKEVSIEYANEAMISQKQELLYIIKQKMQGTKVVVVSESVKPELIEGMVITMGNIVIDASYKAILSKINEKKEAMIRILSEKLCSSLSEVR